MNKLKISEIISSKAQILSIKNGFRDENRRAATLNEQIGVR